MHINCTLSQSLFDRLLFLASVIFLTSKRTLRLLFISLCCGQMMNIYVLVYAMQCDAILSFLVCEITFLARDHSFACALFNNGIFDQSTSRAPRTRSHHITAAELIVLCERSGTITYTTVLRIIIFNCARMHHNSFVLGIAL